jgi:hypothetical protein
MNTVDSSEMFAPMYQATLRHTPKDSAVSSQTKLEVSDKNLGVYPLPILKSWEFNFVNLEASVKTDLGEKIGWDGMDWIDLAQNRDQWRALVNTVMNLRVP